MGRDTIIGNNHKGAIVTLVDRVSKLTLIAKVNTRDEYSISKVIIKLLKNKVAHTLTVDNGKRIR